ncbi:zinc-ribbon and DUF3426 domain-containing protein [Kaarinaea lacus]
MYTQCPKCLTYFQVTADHLKVAQGNVRCGQCSNVFSALGNLSEKPPQGSSTGASNNSKPTTQPAPKPQPTGNRPAANAQSKLSNAIEAIQALNQSSQKILSQSKKSYVTQLQRQAQAKRGYAPIESRNSTAPDLNRDEPDTEAISELAQDLAEKQEKHINFDEALAAVDEIEIDIDEEQVISQEDSPIQYGMSGDEDITPAIDASHLVEDYSMEDSFVADEQPAEKQSAKISKPKSTNVNEEEFNFSELDLPPTEEPDVSEFRNKSSSNKKSTKKKSKPKKKTANKKAKSKKSTKVSQPVVAEPDPGPVPDMVIENNIPTLAIPKQLLEDFQEEQPIHPAHYRSMITWGLGSLMLMLVFLGQTIYFKHNELGQISQFRPWVEFFCKHASCELSLQIDIGQIELLGQDIRSHPKSKKALLVSATIINNAAFTQPYPGLQLNFSDMNGEKVAMRNFNPKDYLPSNMSVEKGMETNVPIQIELEIVDPGKNAVNFEFDFFSI